jgi:RNA polymerase primary sigma factor
MNVEKCFDSNKNMELIKKYFETKNIKYKQELIEGNLKLVFNIASQFKSWAKDEYDFDDMVSEGCLGLMDSIEKFDLSKNTTFSTYAYFYIKKYIKIYLSQGNVYSPLWVTDYYQKFLKREKELMLQGKNVNVDEIAKELNLSTLSLLEIINSKKNISLNEEFNDSEGSLINIIENPEKLEDKSLLALQFEKINDLIDTLNERQKFVIQHRFEINNHNKMTLKEIGKNLNITNEWVRKIEESSLLKLKKLLNKKQQLLKLTYEKNKIENL